jgi:alanyl-tRNA synthetase
MKSEQIRSTFVDFFGDRDHLAMPEGPLTSDDETLLFTNAGMVQFKPYFTGEQVPPRPRLMTTQRCVRTVDIDNIGRTTRHATSFEMLGSFSFHDYYKIESMAWALELLTGGFGLDRGRLWVTVLRGDEETAALWRKLGMPQQGIQSLGPEDNFWSMGGTGGPSGPTTELFYDRGDAFGRGGGPAVNGERYLEVWNLVFMGYRLVDTGMGADRMAMVLQDVPHLQAIDVVEPLLAQVRRLTGRDDELRAHRIITDHVRTSLLMIEQGVVPANGGRGYVLRRLLRRAIYQLHRLGVSEPGLSLLTGDPVIEREERVFERTLRSGTRLVQRELSRGALDAQAVFKLHDTHGFPVDLTEEIATEAGVSVDRRGFEALMAEQRRRSRESLRTPAGGDAVARRGE